MKSSMKKTVLLGITSSIAAFKSLDLIRQLKKENIDVYVIMTEKTTRMISPAEFEKASGHKIAIELFKDKFDYKYILRKREVEHIALADKADLMIICPATANTLAKIAYGIGDDFLTTTALAQTKPLIICPSMNVNMWNNPAVIENVYKLKTRGIQIIEPTEGMLACGYEGKGKLENINVITRKILAQLTRGNSLNGRKIIITAGATQENIDEARIISNKSSGKMGAALAEECYLRSADILFLHSNNSVKPRYQMKSMAFVTADDLEKLIKKFAPKYEIFFHTAAVSDFVPEIPIVGKIPSKDSLVLNLKPRSKIVSKIKKYNPNIKLIAFKAEYALTDKEMIEIARQKLIEWSADAVIANEIGKSDRGFQSDTNEVVIILRNGKNKKITLNTKKNIALSAIDFLTKELSF